MTFARVVVRASIAGLGLLDVSILGRPELVADAMFARRHPFPEETLVDQLVAKRSLGPAGGTIQMVVNELLSATQGNPVRLLQEVDADPSVSIISPTSVRSLARIEEPQVGAAPFLADSHLHSGAAVAFENFVDILATASHPLVTEEDRNEGFASGRGYLTSWVTDGRGNPYCVEILVGAVRVALRRLLDVKRWGLGLPTCMALFEAGLYWKTVAELAQKPIEGNDLQDELLGPLGDSLEPHYSGVERAFSALLATAGEGVPAAAEEALGLAGGMSLMYHVVSSQLGEGLSRFVDRFSAMGAIRDLGYGDSARGIAPALTRRIFEAAFCGPAVAAVDFRKTYRSTGKPIAALEEAIRSTVRAHVTGARDFAESAGRPVRFAVPVGFSRDRRSPARYSWRWCARYPLAGVSSLANATINVLRSSSGAMQVVRGLDTAGDESAMPNWPFLAGYETIQSAHGADALVASIHVGESFSSRLSGIRRIGEVLMGGATVHAIGHGLALDSDMSALIVGEDPMPPTMLDAIADLCWLCSIGVGVDDANGLLERIAVQAAVGRGVSASDLLPGWLTLHSLAGLRAAGICDEEGTFLDYVDDASVMHRSPAQRASWLLGYVSAGHDCFAGYLQPELHSPYRSLAQRVTEEALQIVVGALKERAITVEACPTSNQRLSGLPLLRMGPWQRMADLGLRVSLNSDDPTIFDTNIITEWSRIRAEFGPELANAMATASMESCAARLEPLDDEQLREVSITL